MSTEPATNESKEGVRNSPFAVRSYLGKSAVLIEWWKVLHPWLTYLVFHGRSQDGEREATREVITLQLWILGQVAVLIGSIPQQRKPSQFLVVVFGVVTLIPLASLLSIIGATKTMRNSIAIHHYFDRNSVNLARITFIFAVVVLSVVGVGYMKAQFPGQAKAVALKADNAESYKFVRGAPAYKITAGQVGVVIKVPVPRETVVDPLEVEVSFPKELKGVKLVAAQGKKKNAKEELELTDFQPEVLEVDGGRATVYWHRLTKDNDYELDLILYSTDGKYTPGELSRQIIEKQPIVVKAYVSHP